MRNDQQVNTPLSTYRVQLHQGFTLNDLEGQLDYLHKLGVSAIYAAPLFKAAPGSMHGYDVTDYHVINPEIGDLNDLRRLSDKLKERGMLWIQDIVPNHMAFDPQNERLMDVLERGERSDYASFFDILWDHPAPDLKGKLMVPFLGSSLEECIERGEVKIVFAEKGLEVTYYDNRYPLSVSAYKYLLKESIAISEADGLDELLELTSEAQDQNFTEWKQVKAQWTERVKKDEHKLNLVYDVLNAINADQSKLENILHRQHYVLTYWKRTEREINYRRFFTINSLICLRMEDGNVFDDYHSFLLELYQQNIINGLRIDHIDGLNNPNDYLNKLRALFGEACYIVTEKILEATEDMPVHWPVQGDSGYQFLAQVSQLLTNRQGGQELLKFYQGLLPDTGKYQEVVMKNKKHILEQYMSGEWDNLTRYFFELRLQKRFAYQPIKQALGAFMLCLPVYRVYPEELPVTANCEEVIRETFEKAQSLFTNCSKELDYLLRLFTSASGPDVYAFFNRLMQFTGPLTAKGVEDTTFYVYNAHIAHCEVGDSPAELGIAAKDFHDQMMKKRQLVPRALNTTATHDTKRGEDARIRLNVLSELPAAWEKHVKEWIELNEPFRTRIEKKAAPGRNDEYFIYQAIVGGFPENMQVDDDFVKRLQAYLIKVVREAKVNSNWEDPDEAYEEGCTSFIQKILQPEHSFLKTFIPFMENIIKYARVYSMVQVVLKLTAPGVPDTYQGCELWDLSFVDPDNRRAVDYNKRRRFLEMIIEHEKQRDNVLGPDLDGLRNEGIEKLFVTWKLLNFRKEHPELFIQGDYHPLLVTRKGVALAFTRQFGDESVLIAVPIGLTLYDAPTSNDHVEPVDIILPEPAYGRWTNVFTGEQVVAENRLAVTDIFKKFPVAVLWKNS